MESWENLILNKINNTSNIAEIDWSKKTVRYNPSIKQHQTISQLTPEEFVRAYLIYRLINELHYSPAHIELEKEYIIKHGRDSKSGRVDVIVKDEMGNPYFFIEVKSIDAFDKQIENIEGQLFGLSDAEMKQHKTEVKYLVYYSIDISQNPIQEKIISIDRNEYDTYTKWKRNSSFHTNSMIPSGYGKPMKRVLRKEENAEVGLKSQIHYKEFRKLANRLHNHLWGGGSTSDTDIFYYLVNLILSKIQDEKERENGEDYHFQIKRVGGSSESGDIVFQRLNSLYRRALRDQLNENENNAKSQNVIDRGKFNDEKLIFAVEQLEGYSFLESRNSIENKDILGEFFEIIVRNGFKQEKGSFFTPPPIVNFILYALQIDTLSFDLLNKNQKLPYIIDPSAGSGTFLIEAMRLIVKEIKTKQKNKVSSSQQTRERFSELFDQKNENSWARDFLYGIENNTDLGTSSKVNMLLHGDGSANIFVKDGLFPFQYYEKPNTQLDSNRTNEVYEKSVNESFDVVVSNPPFSVKIAPETKKQLIDGFVFGKKNHQKIYL